MAGGRPPAFDREDYKARHAVECVISRLRWNRAVAAARCRADSENGDHVDDPSARVLTRLIATLDRTGNTFVVIQSDDDPVWFTFVVLLDPHTYEVERQDYRSGEHLRATTANPVTIAHDLTTWMTSCDHQDQPPRPTNF